MNAHLSAFHRPSRRALNATFFSMAALLLTLPSAVSAAGSAETDSKRIGVEKVQVYPQAAEKIRIEPDYPGSYPVDVEIWTRKGDGAKYCVGEPIEIYFRANVDAYVAIYNTDTRGRTQKLFPNRYDHDNFVEGGRTYRLPARGYDYRIEGPSGRETLKAVAALDRRDLRSGRHLPASSHSYDYDDDRYEDRYDRHDRSRTKVRVERIAVVPTELAVDTISHRVRDGYRCERRYSRTRPWWK